MFGDPKPMIISIIVAASTNRAIGYNNRLPWHLPADLKHFRSKTLYHPVIMGRRTFASIGTPLPKRTNIILTRDPNYKAPEPCVVVHSLQEALLQAAQTGSKELFVIGGLQVYLQVLPETEKIYYTEVHAVTAGDTFFPELDLNTWQEVYREKHTPDKSNPYAYSFVEWSRKLLLSHCKLMKG